MNNEEVKIKERHKELNNLPYIKKIKISNKSLEKAVKESKNLLKSIEKHDENKKRNGDKLNNLIKELNDRKKDNKKTDEILKKYYEKEAQKTSKKMEKYNKMINDNLDMLSKKSKIINKLIELYYLIHLYYLNKIDNNLELNEEIDNVSITNEINKLELKLIDQKGKRYVNLPILLSKLNINNSKELISDIKNLLNNLQDTKQITKQVYNNLIKAITYVKSTMEEPNSLEHSSLERNVYDIYKNNS